MESEFDVDCLPAGLIEAIERHFPDTSISYQPTFGISKPSELIAVQLYDAYHNPLLAFGLGPNEGDWARVQKAATELQRAIKALGQDGIRELSWAAPLWWDRDKPLSYEAYLLAALAKDAASEMRVKRKAGVKASKKRDWRSAALAKTARKIWAEQKWQSNSEHYGPVVPNELSILALPENERRAEKKRFLEYETHLEEFAPKTEKHDAPGPFGRLLSDILCVFGCSGSAASALRSMVQAQDAISGVSRNAKKI